MKRMAIIACLLTLAAGCSAGETLVEGRARFKVDLPKPNTDTIQLTYVAGSATGDLGKHLVANQRIDVDSAEVPTKPRVGEEFDCQVRVRQEPASERRPITITDCKRL